MVDFRKKLAKGNIEVKVKPTEIYDTLDRRSETGPLRPIQREILERWFQERQHDKDLIIKLHTGEGKTLIGLLILQSKLNQGKGPCIFVCPNIYLVNQVILEAKKFGVPICSIEKDNDLPNDFLEGKKILVTHIQKIFNGKSIFGLDNNYTSVGCIILDDSHACIDAIKNAFTIRIERIHPLYNELLSLFENDLRDQGEGSFLDIKSSSYDILLPVPYWAWIDNKTKILELLYKHKDEGIIAFAWPIIKNHIDNCQALITGNELEIVPCYIPVESFGTFSKANQRILMSATTQDDSFFIKGLGFSTNSVNNPLIDINQKWSGEKMLLIPSLIDDSLDRDLIVTKFAPAFKTNHGRVALVPSFSRAEQYAHRGSKVADTKNIFQLVSELKKGEYTSMIVVVNRYDGIDLPDDACRILIIDSLPYFNSLSDRYEEQARANSDILNIKMAQKIEQGLGRSVRGEKDYSVILLIGTDLVKFIKSSSTNKYFSSQTRKQITIGLEIANWAKADLKDGETAFNVVSGLVRQSLQRDEAWKEFYKEEMDKIDYDAHSGNLYDILQSEKEAEELSYKGDYESAASKVQYLIDNYIDEEVEKGWYLQILARYTYFLSKSESNKLQKAAFSHNLQLLKPRDGVVYKKVDYINENRINRIKQWIEKYSSYSDLMLSVENTLSDLSFGSDAEKFESALKEIGALIGFISQRPDKEYKKGPDNLWCGVDNRYFIFECKNEVKSERDEISKNEASQMNSHCGWFDNTYGPVKVTRILVIPTNKLSYYGDFTHEVKIMRKGKLKSLKEAIKGFIKEFKPYNIKELSDGKIQEFINVHKLDLHSLEDEYVEDYVKSK